MKKQTNLGQKGFTIIELMIATTVLSVILVLVTVLMISIGNLYYKGVNQARVQDDVRSVTDELGQHLQLSSQQPAQSDSGDSRNTFSGIVMNAYCIGATRYSYVMGVEIGQKPPTALTALKHVLWRDTIPTGANCLADNLTVTTPTDKIGNGTKGTELIAPRSRLTQFCIGTVSSAGVCTTNVNSPYSLAIGVAYGDNDLLRNVNAPPLSSPNAVCAGSKGDQFCSTAYLNTTVVSRLTNSGL